MPVVTIRVPDKLGPGIPVRVHEVVQALFPVARPKALSCPMFLNPAAPVVDPLRIFGEGQLHSVRTNAAPNGKATATTKFCGLKAE